MLPDTYNPELFHKPAFAAGRMTTRRRGFSTLADILCFSIPLASAWTIKLIGELPIGEVIALLLLPVVLLHYHGRVWSPLNRNIYIMMGFWFIGQVVTDIYRGSRPDQLARGWAAIIFLGLDIAVMTALIANKPRRLIIFALGICPIALIHILRGDAGEGAPADVVWKFGWGPLLNDLTLILCCYFAWRKRYTVIIGLVLTLITVNLLQNYRSAALVLTLTLILCVPLPETVAQLKLDRKGRRPFDTRILIMILLGGMGMSIIAMLYSYTASQGYLGDRAQAKYEAQSRGKFGVLVGGRPETLVSLTAVAESPIIGHGSWAEDPKYMEMLLDRLWEDGYALEASDLPQVDQDAYLIPTHSHLFGAWVWAGILGAAFWFYFLYLLLRCAGLLISLRLWMAPYLAYTFVSSVWNVFFSPMGSSRRIGLAFIVACMGFVFHADRQESMHLKQLFRRYGPNVLRSMRKQEEAAASRR